MNIDQWKFSPIRLECGEKERRDGFPSSLSWGAASRGEKKCTIFPRYPFSLSCSPSSRSYVTPGRLLSVVSRCPSSPPICTKAWARSAFGKKEEKRTSKASGWNPILLLLHIISGQKKIRSMSTRGWIHRYLRFKLLLCQKDPFLFHSRFFFFPPRSLFSCVRIFQDHTLTFESVRVETNGAWPRTDFFPFSFASKCLF